ncbi:hypothetical protein FHS83_001074 [Rhizomicrobium palustre]|uniref:Vacuolar membrane protease n=1 Tax=Rhizomicrobium palustre TaxID=189966 RepID=A0A846MWI1_9PROT|nr:M20/M25/M40 family metallo-hydrolase [Rhizomicrobium palustre]NIK87756.1 hypothetical protein [Rhizomicrobium palustre]
MRNGFLVLVAAVALALWCSEPPAPKAANAPADQFSAGRAFLDIAEIAQRPHPIGSADHERVKAYLVSRLTAMGLTPVTQSERILRQGHGRAVSAPITNIIATLKGADAQAPAVLVMSHYDTVPDSPGAADDTAGVASALEIAHVMQRAGTPPRDIIFLFTDGEEMGLLGATAFFAHHPLVSHIGAVINLEARGDSGRVNMFETGPNNRAAIALWRAEVSHPTANSLASAIYKLMPNDTDMTLSVQRGLPGLNFAFMGDEMAYHTPVSTPEHINLGSVQDMGNSALAAVKAFAATIPAQTENSVYSDFLGVFLIQYSFFTGWVLFAAAALAMFTAIFLAQRSTPFAWGRGILGALFAIGVPALLLWLAGLSFGAVHHYMRVAYFDYLLAGAGLIALGAGLFCAGSFEDRWRPAAVWQVLMLITLALATAFQLYMPEGAYVIVWPLLAASCIAILRYGVFRGEDHFGAVLVTGLVALIFIAQVVMMALMAFTSLGVDLPLVLVAPLLPVLLLTLVVPGGRLPRAVSLLILIGGAALFAYGRMAPPTSTHPQPTIVSYVYDAGSGKAYRAEYLSNGDAWTKAVLGPNAQKGPLPWFSRRSGWFTETKAVPVPSADLSVARLGDKLEVTMTAAPGAAYAELSFRDKAGAGPEELMPAAKQSNARDVRYFAPDRFTWEVPVPKSGALEIRASVLYPEWPEAAQKLPSLPEGKMAFSYHAATEVMLKREWKK